MQLQRIRGSIQARSQTVRIGTEWDTIYSLQDWASAQLTTGAMHAYAWNVMIHLHLASGERHMSPRGPADLSSRIHSG